MPCIGREARLSYAQVARILRDLGHEVFNPAEHERAIEIDNLEFDGLNGIANGIAVDFIYLCLSHIHYKTDTIAFQHDWKSSDGARKLHELYRDSDHLNFIYLPEDVESYKGDQKNN